METSEKLPLHVKARRERGADYPERFPVPDHLVGWDTPYPGYAPPYHVAAVVLANDSSVNRGGWADPEDLSRLGEFPGRTLAGRVRRDEGGRPLNPAGRTGLAGRGLLGKWGANYAADPIITRVSRREKRLELLAVQRRDNGQWAIPGGMVDRGEQVSRTLARELQEETGITLDMGRGRLVYQGYVDDPRNTDNAWMETTASHLHLDPETAQRLEPRAGSDARAVRWFPLTPDSIRTLYASHCALVITALAALAGDPALPGEEREVVAALLAAI